VSLWGVMGINYGKGYRITGKVKGGIILFVAIFLFEFMCLCFLVYSTITAIINGSVEIFVEIIIYFAVMWVILITLWILYWCTMITKIIIDNSKLTLDAVLVKQIIPIDALKDAKIDLIWANYLVQGRYIRFCIRGEIYRFWLTKKSKEGIIKIISMSEIISANQKKELFEKIEWTYNNLIYGV
jgi:hypothetical protein